MPLENICGEWQVIGASGQKSASKTLIHRKRVLRKEADNNTPGRRREQLMLDVIVVAIALVFFALSVGYTLACDRL
jgi:hypothetical protein